MSKTTILAILVATSIALAACKGDESESSMAGAGGQSGHAGDMSGGAGGQGATSATGGAGAGGQNGDASPCSDLCVIVEALDCPGDTASLCMSECERYWGSTTCQMELRGMLSCFAAQPQASWECNAQSMEAEPVAGLCDTEQSALEDCLGA